MTDKFTETPFTRQFKKDAAELRRRVTGEEVETARTTNCPFCGASPEQRHDPNCGLQ
jgi:hypothetical protein